MMKKTISAGLTLSLLVLISAATVRAEQWGKKTVITFSEPVEVPGRVLPAGTYTFELLDSMSDRHLVQIFTADGSQIIATVMAIPDYRLAPSDQTVIKFLEVPRGSPEAIRAWFYPGNTVGQEFVYPKPRALALAMAAKAIVPAMAVDVTGVDALKSAPIVAITPDAQEIPVGVAIQTTPLDTFAPLGVLAGTPGAGIALQNARQLPRTASTLPLIVLLGLGSVGIAFGVMMFLRRAPASAV